MASDADLDGISKQIHKIEVSSNYEKIDLPDGKKGLIPKDSDSRQPLYFIEDLDGQDDELLNEVHAFFSTFFKPEDMDSVENIRDFLNRENYPGWPSKIFINAAKDHEGKIVGALMAHYASNLDESGQRLGSGSVLIGYVLSRRMGLAGQLHASIFRQADTYAAKMNESVKIIAGETLPAAEKFFNNVGINRVYYQKNGAFIQVPYTHPPLEWSQECGEALSGTSPEHFMMGLVKGHEEIGSEELLQAALSTFRTFNMPPLQYFKNEAAYQKMMKTVMLYFQKLKNDLAEIPVLHLISQKKRSEMKENGVIFREFDEADKWYNFTEKPAIKVAG